MNFVLGFFREIKIIFHIFRIQWPAAHWPHPPAEMTSTLLPNSLVPELLPSEWPDQEPESDQSSDLLSLVMPEIHPSNNNCFHTPFWDLLCPKLWAFSVLWWPFCSYSPSRKIIFHQKLFLFFSLAHFDKKVLKNGPSICSSEEKVNYYKRKILIFRKLHTPPPISYGKKTVNVEDQSYFIEENLKIC